MIEIGEGDREKYHHSWKQRKYETAVTNKASEQNERKIFTNHDDTKFFNNLTSEIFHSCKTG